VNKEEIEVLMDIVSQDCYDGKDAEGNSRYDSISVSAYADAIRLLAKYGVLKITKEISHRWVTAVEVK
jgi:hypothetical protein